MHLDTSEADNFWKLWAVSPFSTMFSTPLAISIKIYHMLAIMSLNYCQHVFKNRLLQISCLWKIVNQPNFMLWVLELPHMIKEIINPFYIQQTSTNECLTIKWNWKHFCIRKNNYLWAIHSLATMFLKVFWCRCVKRHP